MIRRVSAGSAVPTKLHQRFVGSASVRISLLSPTIPIVIGREEDTGRRHYVFIRVINLQLFVGITIHLTIRPAVL